MVTALDHYYHDVRDKQGRPTAAATNNNKALSGRYIIEFDENYQGTATRFVQELEHEHDHIRWKVAHDYDTESIFRGISVELKQNNNLHAAANGNATSNTLLPSEHQVIHHVIEKQHVKRVFPVVEIQRPTIQHYSQIDPEDLFISSDVVGLPFSHNMTQVDRVHTELGFYGDGITVGIIDTGVDYYHPALGGGFGPGYKGYDLVGDRFNITDPSSVDPKDTPLDTCTDPSSGHGTHVTGIIGAEDKKYNFTGVAPHATLGMWRIFGCTGSTSNDLVIKAMIMAYEAGCNVINLSLGGANSWPEDSSALVADRISRRNVTMVIAAGNEGRSGAFMISSPSTGNDVISVASVDNDYSLQRTLFVDSTGAKFPYELSSTTDEIANGTLVVYSNNSDETENDGCPDTTPDTDLTGHIVLVKRGTCEFDLKARHIAEAGATAMLVYDKEGVDVFKPTTQSAPIPVAAVSHETGLALIAQQQQPVSITFSDMLHQVPISTAGLISQFSSTGPTFEMGMKPDVAGVGGFIFSTLPTNRGSYGILSGTSMASPYVAGVCALYLQAHGATRDPLFVRDQLQNYAVEVRATGNHDSIPLDNPVRQGAGLVQAYDTIQGGIHISPGKISFNDTVRYAPRTVTITNMHDYAVTLTLENIPGVPVEPYDTARYGFALVEPAPSNTTLTADLSFDKSITLDAGESRQMTVSVNGFNQEPSPDKPYPFYGGHIRLTDAQETSSGTVQFPYMGVIGNVTEIPIFDHGFPFITNNQELSSLHSLESLQDAGNRTRGGQDSDDDNDGSDGFTEYIITRSPNQDGQESSVLVVMRFLMGTAHLEAQVLNSEQAAIGAAYTINHVQRNTMDDTSMVVVDSWNGTYIPNTFDNEQRQVPVENGTYYLRWRALRLFADPLNPNSWESITSKRIIVN
ncbi:peptidase S8/S53 domain-containing protein [Zychaea mexicana]|uniref:peptidase S8/S53 domain-containing protein n=1 Tax=Zychaea mexicana TaxID=64656 RepID=UPI0022FDFD53|nr:peptidase S8/S53 domain-containing protein [Zychaea mexicana]KAI9495421.1 peptidase S8/S53 domain-containing protein [Zychaea mexicana]